MINVPEIFKRKVVYADNAVNMIIISSTPSFIKMSA